MNGTCPICGGTTVFKDYGDYWEVVCKKCGAVLAAKGVGGGIWTELFN